MSSYMDLDNEYKGKRFRVVHCNGAMESFEKAKKHLSRQKAKSFSRGMAHQIQRLADGHKMTKENFPPEGDLPPQAGKKRFYALKRIPIRGYCWLSSNYPNTYFLSHYVYKDYQKLADKDINKVCENWVRIEENGNGR